MTDHSTYRDRLEIADVLLKYFRSLDRLDRELLESVFSDDAHLDYPGAYVGGKSGFIDWVLDVVAACSQTAHISGNHLVELDGDRARSEMYAVAYHSVDADRDHAWAGQFVTMWLRYIDELERRPSGWKVTRRQVAHIWTRMEPDDTTTEPMSPGRRDRSDPIYRDR